MNFWEKFDNEWAPKLGMRMPTFRAVLREAQFRNVKSIVETGTIRTDQNWEGDGQSTIMLAEFAKERGGAFTTVDISSEATDLAKQLVPNITVRCEDSVKFLSKLKYPIDLLYLDSFDVNMARPHPAALHCLMELTSALPWLHSGSIVFVDDSPMSPNMEVGGKGLYVAHYFHKLGITPFTFGYQVAWVMP
jgi:predicted O-methyltransferase YrrM